MRVVEHDGLLIGAVADGAGGIGGGAAAAEFVVAAAASDVQGPRGVRDPRFWVTRLLEIDAALAAMADGQAAGVIAAAFEGEVVGGAVGDAVAWLVSPSGVNDLTAGTARKPLLGDGAAVPRGFGPVQLGSSTLLLATDGLWKYASRSSLSDLVVNAMIPGPCAELIDAVRLRSGGLQDDVGVVLVRGV